MQKIDILLAHPYKHHIFNMVAGCRAASKSVKIITPLYKKNIGFFVAKIPGIIGKKASGYWHADIAPETVISPWYWQILKLLSLTFKFEIDKIFDLYVATLIKHGFISPKIIITMQSYMPKSVLEAKKRGILVWNDQISNQSESAINRVNQHLAAFNMATIDHDYLNREMIAQADIITTPSKYCHDGIKESDTKNTPIKIIPYGVSDAFFPIKKEETNDTITIVARANSVRKGGHLLLSVLSKHGSMLLEKSLLKKINIIIIGKLDNNLSRHFENLEFNPGINITAQDYAHSDIPAILRTADLFIMPALSESLSLICIEAIKTGLPSLITPYCGIDDHNEKGIGATIEATEESIFSELEKILTQRQTWPSMTNKAINFSHDFSWRKYENSIANVAKELLC